MRQTGMKTPAMVFAALLAGSALTACADQGPSPAHPLPVTSTPGGTVDPTPSPAGPTPTPTPSPAGPSKPAGGAATLTGTVTAGVEPNCFLLDGNLLVGAPRGALRAGARVTVTGHPQPNLMTTCQQGTPFMVESVRPG
jgi:hypothetical protein